jgi:uracil-DNA glycosylase
MRLHLPKLSFAVALTLLGCAGEPVTDVAATAAAATGNDDPASRYVGSPLEFDVGPRAGDGWAELFAAVPSYRVISRQLGAAWLQVNPQTGTTKLEQVNAERAAQSPPLPPIPRYTLTNDKFRFETGPIFYRGRLDGSARVLVVGQDAATDEALVHRAFVGGTGQKVQAFLNQVGITKSYVCVNTFIYSIYEQYDEFAHELATATAIKDYRNGVFDKVLHDNHIELIVSFGAAAHESVRIYRDEKLGGHLPAGVIWVQMLHPGGAGIDPTQVQRIAASFTKGWNTVWNQKRRVAGWLRSDEDGRHSRGSTYYYVSNDIPYRDLPYAASREIGTGGTKSERAAGGIQVQLRSAAGARYSAPDVPFPVTASKAASGLVMAPGELAWEPAKAHPGVADAGPTPEWAQLLATTPSLATVEQESGVELATDFTTPVWYRGRLGTPVRLLVLAQDGGVDRLVSGRALTGDSGQKINHLLSNVGAPNDYVMLDVVPFGIANIASEQLPAVAMAPSLAAVRAQIIGKLLTDAHPTVVLTFGALAEQAFAAAAPGASVTWIKLADPHAADAYLSWNANLAALRSAFATPPSTVTTPYKATTFAKARLMVPRADLPWGVPLWQGTSGDLSQQPDQSWIFWNAPVWVKYEPSAP